MELWAVLLGGVLTLAGSFVGQRRAERVRANEARRERFEAYREQLSETIVAVDEWLATLREHSLRVMYLEGETMDVKFDRAADVMEAATVDARRALLRSLVGLPAGTPASLADLVAQLRDTLQETHDFAYECALHESAHEPGQPAPPEATARASAQFDVAEEQVNALVTASREAFQSAEVGGS